MKCKNDCGIELTGRQKFCSDKCRKQFKRKSDKLERSNSDTVEVGQKSDIFLNPEFEVTLEVKPESVTKIEEVPVFVNTEDTFDAADSAAEKTREAVLSGNSDNNLSAYKDGADSLSTHHERFTADGGKDNCLARATANDLYVAINSYPQDTWKDNPEFKELMKRLHSMSVEELEAGGYDVPCWKYSEAA